MRPIHICLGCACVYLPAPDRPHSPVHCGAPMCRATVEAILGQTGIPVERIADMALRAAGLAGEPRRPRTARRARGRRPASPTGARSKLL